MPKKSKEIPMSTKIWVSVGLLFALFIMAVMIAAILSLSSSSSTLGKNTAVIRITGPIMGDSAGGLFSSGFVSSRETVMLLDKAAKDTSIKAVIIEINSPGGTPVASDEIGTAVMKVRAEGKPVVAWIRDVGASGAYWIASNSDYVVANRMSMTGSIGVYGSYLSFEDFIDEWNVTSNRLVSGSKKDVGSPYRTLEKSEREYLQEKLDKIHVFFIEEVAENRNMSFTEVEKYADGSIYLGSEAFELGLVDELGGEAEVIAYLENVTGEKISTKIFETEQSLFGELFGIKSDSPLPVDAEWFVPQLR